VKRLAALVLFAGALFACAAPANAHAVLVASDPAAGERIDRSPATVTLTFDENVETSLGSLRVLDAAGDVHSSGDAHHPDGDAHRVAIAVDGMARGRYVVAWKVVSADSHLVSGAFAFGVGVAAGDPPVAAADNGAQVLLPFLHFFLLAAALLGIGLPIGAATIGRRTRSKPAGIEFAAWIVLAFTAFTDIAFRADLAGGSLASAFTTHVGILRLVTVGAAACGVLALLRRTRTWWLLIPASIAVTVSLSLAGHAASGAFAPLSVAADALHLLAAASWIGVLAIATTLDGEPELRGISPIAATAVGVLIVTGIAQTIRNAGSLGALVTTTYGRAIDLKIALLVLLLMLAINARALLARGNTRIGGRVRAELWLLTLVIAVTAVLVETPLPRELAAAGALVEASFTVRDIHVDAVATPIDDRHDRIRVTGSAPLDGADVSVTEQRRHVGPLVVPLTRHGASDFTGTIVLPFAGYWQVRISVRSGPFDEAHRTIALPDASP
jgi:copper transport protein